MRVLLLLIVFSEILYSQDTDTKRTFNIVWNTQLDAGSDHVSAQFISKYLRGGFISQSTKDAFFEKLESENTAGAIVSSQITLKKYRNSDDDAVLRSNYSFGIDHFSVFDAVFTKDIFGLYFYGNQRYEDIKADLSGMHFSELSFQTIKLGLFQRVSKFGFGINVGYVLGQSHIDITTKKSSIYTAPDGRYIDFSLKANALTTDIDKSNFFSGQGEGFAVDLKLVYNYMNKSLLGFQIDRLGSLNWNDDYKEQYVDSIYRFEGVNITSLLDSFTLDLKSPEELKDDFVKTRPASDKKMNLPTSYSFVLHHQFVEDKLWLNSKFNFMNYGNYKPSLQCDLNFQPLKILSIGVDAGIGGYSKWNAGVNVGINLIDRIKIDIQARSLFNILNLDKPASGIGSARLVIGL